MGFIKSGVRPIGRKARLLKRSPVLWEYILCTQISYSTDFLTN